MSYSVDATVTMGEDHKVTISLPAEVPVGELRIVATIESAGPARKLTGKELVESEFFGDLKDAEGWPNTPEEFQEWRRKLWERPSA